MTHDLPNTDSAPIPPRYVRQSQFAALGTEGQARILQSTALVVGCGALGSVIANTLARAGVGTVRIVDRDFLEWNNLQRQVLYDEQDVRNGLPKAIAAANRLRQINSLVTIEPHVADVSSQNIHTLAEGVQVIVDGTDNFETRFLINDYSLRFHVPWVFGGCIGAEGQTMTVIPDRSACLRCLIPEVPPPGTSPTCDTAGILAPIINVIASIQACEALKILSGNVDAVHPGMYVFDLWENRVRQIKVDSLRASGGCPACSGQQFPWLDGTRTSQSAILCGRNAVQLSFPQRGRVSLEQMAEKLSSLGKVQTNPFLLRFYVDNITITLFADGRAIVSGTDDVAQARSLYARYIGN
ncbi:MAG: ThiF family adenylyltransferase [Pirellulaceae bacterium]